MLRCNPALRQLGFDARDRVVVIHADDLGMCHATLPAFVELMEYGLVSCGSVMVPCPWFPYAAALWRNCPTADVGLHLTLTSEWRTYRWGPLTTRDPATGLLDEAGYFPHYTSTLWQQVDIAAAGAEMQAQIAHARQAGLEPTHLDSHMFAILDPRLLPRYVALGFAHSIPALVIRRWTSVWQYDPQTEQAICHWEEQGMPIFDHLAEMPLEACHADRLRQATALFDALPPGLSCLLLHPALDTPELRAIAPDWPCRVADYVAFLSAELRNHVRQAGIQVIGYRALRDVMRARL
jgi:predicted glycoside hydrolase/deacetylase ChbG (UPF0249 family)